MTSHIKDHRFYRNSTRLFNLKHLCLTISSRAEGGVGVRVFKQIHGGSNDGSDTLTPEGSAD